MNASRATSADRRAETDAKTEARMQQRRQRPLPIWLASRRRRRAIALVPAALFVIGVAAALSTETLSGMLMLVMAALGIAGMVVMRRATQMLDAAPFTLLDEREISQRDRGYRDAYHLTFTLVSLLVTLAAINSFAAKFSTEALFDSDGWTTLTLTSFLTVFLLPAAALTWRWQAPTDDHDQ